MAERTAPSGAPPARRSVTSLPCAACKTPVDPLRAARVACFDERFFYFCSASCREGFQPERRRDSLAELRAPSPAQPAEYSDARSAAAQALMSVESDGIEELSASPLDYDTEAAEPLDDAGAESPPSEVVDAPRPTDIGTLLLAIALVASALAVLLLLAGSSGPALTARIVLLLAAAASLAARALTPGHDAAEAHPLVLLFGPLLATTAAVWARIAQSPDAGSLITTAGLVSAAVAASSWLADWARSPVDAERERIVEGLNQHGHRIVGDEIGPARADDLRPGEEIVIETGETVPVDAAILAGTAKVKPWLGATTVLGRGEGDALVAGATIVEGRLRAIASWTGNDRAWMRLTHDPRRRADVHAPIASLGRKVAERGAFVAASVAALTAYSSNREPVVMLQFAAAAYAAFANGTVAVLAPLLTARAVLDALRRGIAFRTAEALDRSARVSTAAFCARGTLLLGEPEVASIDALGQKDPGTVLAILAGAEGGSAHPTATAILRAARARGVRPDGVRNPTQLSGLGVTAVASNGQPIVVGSRALMLKERISVAAAESRITDLEALGRSVILIALGGRLIGVVGLQDGLRPGARAAVQHLLDVGVEPVLLSGDARETCEALARAVDIEHIRPEVLPSERGDEIRRLSDGGATVAVLGRSPTDDVALSAADVSVALASAGASSAEWLVQLASDDVRDAAFALRLAHVYRRRVLGTMGVALLPGALAALAMSIGLVSASVVPLATISGGAVAIFRIRSRT